MKTLDLLIFCGLFLLVIGIMVFASDNTVFITGVSTFLGLSDTPNSYVGDANKLVRVKADQTGLEFINAVDLNADLNGSFLRLGGSNQSSWTPTSVNVPLLNASSLTGFSVGTSGATIPLLNTANTFGANQLFGTTNVLQFRDSDLNISSPKDAVLQIETDQNLLVRLRNLLIQNPDLRNPVFSVNTDFNGVGINGFPSPTSDINIGSGEKPKQFGLSINKYFSGTISPPRAFNMILDFNNINGCANPGCVIQYGQITDYRKITSGGSTDIIPQSYQSFNRTTDFNSNKTTSVITIYGGGITDNGRYSATLSNSTMYNYVIGGISSIGFGHTVNPTIDIPVNRSYRYESGLARYDFSNSRTVINGSFIGSQYGLYISGTPYSDSNSRNYGFRNTATGGNNGLFLSNESDWNNLLGLNNSLTYFGGQVAGDHNASISFNSDGNFTFNADANTANRNPKSGFRFINSNMFIDQNMRIDQNLNVLGGYVAGGLVGITKTITVADSTLLATCTITITKGIITGTTC